MNKLKVFEVFKTKDRISSIDIFRFFAITAVVVFHVNKKLHFGFLGVDLFFVISGLLYNNVFSSIFNFDFYYHICRRKIT